MIGKLTGHVDHIDNDHIILNVQSVGYIIYCSNSFLVSLEIGQNISIFIHQTVREDGVYLYGFSDLENKKQFLQLITVKGLGPKIALNILSEMKVADIHCAISQQDKTKFKNISGIGQKLAERIIVELKGLYPIVNSPQYVNDISLDAVSALVNLGITKSEAHAKILKILQKNPDISIDLLVTKALSQ